MIEPNCRTCVYRRSVPGDCHSRCNNPNAKVKGNAHGIKNGWFRWPVNFDPTWLVECTGYSDKKEDNLPEQTYNPLIEILGMLG